jgi:hypothetical protein
LFFGMMYFLVQSQRRTASWGSGGLAQRDLQTKMGRAVLKSDARGSERIVGNSETTAVRLVGIKKNKK